MSNNLVKWPQRVWEPDYAVTADEYGIRSGKWYSRPVTEEDKVRRAEVTQRLQAVEIVEG